MPFTALQTSPCEVELDEVVVHARLLTTTQRATYSSSPTGSNTAPDNEDDQIAKPEGDEEPLPATSSIADGVRMIAGGIENLLHQLCIRVRGLSVHIVAPGDLPGALEPCLLLSLASCTFSSSDNVSESSGVAGKPLLLDKRCSIDGLLLELLMQPSRRSMDEDVGDRRDESSEEDDNNQDDSNDDAVSAEEAQSDIGDTQQGPASCCVLLCNNQGAGCAASLRLRLESADGLQSGEVAVDVHMEPLQLQLHSSVLVHMLTIAQRATAGRTTATTTRFVCLRIDAYEESTSNNNNNTMWANTPNRLCNLTTPQCPCRLTSAPLAAAAPIRDDTHCRTAPFSWNLAPRRAVFCSRCLYLGRLHPADVAAAGRLGGPPERAPPRPPPSGSTHRLGA